MRNSINWPQLSVAGLLAVTGGYVVVSGFSYDVGSARNIGPGFFPVALGLLMLVIVFFVALEGVRDAAIDVLWVPRPLLAISAGMVGFALALETAGLIPATVILVLLSSLAEGPLRAKTTVINAIALSAMGVLLFIEAFSLPLPAINW